MEHTVNQTYTHKPRALLIAEKPSVARDINNAYQKIKSKYPYELDITAAAGHLIGLCEPDEYEDSFGWGTPWTKEVLPMIPTQWKKKPIKAQLLKQIRDMYQNGNYDYVINAGDAGREGQLIQHLIYEAIGVSVPVLRYWADDTSEKTIIHSLNHLVPNEEYKGLTMASILRMYFDWLIGMNFSRAATLSLHRHAFLGRVLTATLSMIVQREWEIRNFQPEDYYELETEFQTSSGTQYKGLLINPTTDKYLYAFGSKDILANLDLADSGMVLDIKDEEKQKYAPTLYNLSDLQKECAAKYGYSPSYTLSIAQSLYDKHLLSYPRTESKCLSSAMVDDIPLLLKSIQCITEIQPIVENVLKDTLTLNKIYKTKKYFNDSKVSDHPALTPTNIQPNLSELSADEINIYTLVAKRLLSIFLPPQLSLQTAVVTEVNGHQFKSTGTVIKEPGWTILYQTDSTNTDSILPELCHGESVSVVSSTILEKTTQPPSRYNHSTIISAMETAGRTLDDKELEKVLMESAGLGTVATRGEILLKLEKYKYITIEQKTKNKPGKIIPTQEAMELINALQGHNIISPELTAQWEKKLKDVEKGACSYEMFYKAMIAFVKVETTNLLSLQELQSIRPNIIGQCPKCHKNLLDGNKFVYCEDFDFTTPEEQNTACNFALPKNIGKTILSSSDIKNLITKGSTSEKTITWNNGEKTVTKLILKDYKLSFPTQESLGPCPICGSDVYSGKFGFYCKNAAKSSNTTPSCKFSIYKSLGTTMIKPSYIRQILKNGHTDREIKITWKSGKSITRRLVLNEQFKLTLEEYTDIPICECPHCKQGTIYEKKKGFTCSNYGSSCCFSLYKYPNNTTMLAQDITKLLNGEFVTKEVQFKDKSKHTVQYMISYDEQNKKYTYKFVSNKDQSFH